MENPPATLRYGVRRLIALTMAVLNFSAAVAFASPLDRGVSHGVLKLSGVVTVDDVRAVSGQTIFSGNNIVTGNKSSSILELGSLSRLTLSEQTELALDFSATSISGWLRQGEIRVFLPSARALSIATPDGVVVTDSSQPAVFSVQLEADATRVSVDTGRVELRAGNNGRVLASGETFSIARDSLAVPAPPQNLGKSQKVGIIAGIGAGLAAILIAIIGEEPRETDEFGGCVIVPSGSNDGRGMCP
jgi:ferric-dicitrate binding protein FerR (iron transport regulator)